MTRYTTIGGYPNTDPYYVSPEEEAAMEQVESRDHGPWGERQRQKCSLCGETRLHHIWDSICPSGGPTQWFTSDDARHAFEKAMAPRENPKHPMFANHNCAYCGSGEKPCKQGNPSQCEFPHARND